METDMKKTISDDGSSITYNCIIGRKTPIVVQQDPHDRKSGNREGVWYVFKISPRKVLTEFYGRKSECVHYAEQLVEDMEANKSKRK
jgi:hypothetical protein